ncbi:hypothetical protein AYI69_g8625, partial [Smittium culicis]
MYYSLTETINVMTDLGRNETIGADHIHASPCR